MHHCIFVQAIVPILLWLSGLSGSIPAAAARLCSPAETVFLGETVRVGDLADGKPARFTVELPAPGLLAVEVSVPGSEAAIPWVGVGEQTCSPGRVTTPVEVLAGSLSRQVFLADAGSYRIEVGSISSSPRRAAIKLTTRFVDLEYLGLSSKDVGLASSAPSAKSSGEESSGGTGEEGSGSTGEEGSGGTGEEGTGDPDTEESVNEILPLTAPPVSGTDKAVWDLLEVFRGSPGCSELGELADDAAVCARSLYWNKAVEGVLGNGWGDDHDYYRFLLDQARTVRVAASGNIDTFGSLYDQYGQRLVVGDDGGEGENFAFEVMLGPGEYWVRVEGNGEGAFALIVE